MDENQLLKIVTATFAAPMIQTAINSEMVGIDFGGDGKVSDEKMNQIVELSEWYAKRFLQPTN